MPTKPARPAIPPAVSVPIPGVPLPRSTTHAASTGNPAIWDSTVTARVRERSEEHTSELQSRSDLVCRLLLEKKKKNANTQQMRGQFTRYNLPLMPLNNADRQVSRRHNNTRHTTRRR